MRRFNALASGNDAEALEAHVAQAASKLAPKPQRPSPTVTVSGSTVTVDKAVVSINEARGGIEIRFPCALDITHTAKLKSKRFRFSKYKCGTFQTTTPGTRVYDRRWYAKYTLDLELWAMSFAKSFNDCVATPASVAAVSTPQPVSTPPVKARIKVSAEHVVKTAVNPAIRALRLHLLLKRK